MTAKLRREAFDLRLALGTMLEDLLFANETLEEGDGPSGGDANRQDRSDPERVSGQKRQVCGLACAWLAAHDSPNHPTLAETYGPIPFGQARRRA